MKYLPGAAIVLAILLYRPPAADTSTVILQYEYRDAETPIGAIDGRNVRYVLLYAPSPTASLQLFKNGVLMAGAADFTVSGNVVVWISTATLPQKGDTLTAFYRK